MPPQHCVGLRNLNPSAAPGFLVCFFREEWCRRQLEGDEVCDVSKPISIQISRFLGTYIIQQYLFSWKYMLYKQAAVIQPGYVLCIHSIFFCGEQPRPKTVKHVSIYFSYKPRQSAGVSNCCCFHLFSETQQKMFHTPKTSPAMIGPWEQVTDRRPLICFDVISQVAFFF